MNYEVRQKAGGRRQGVEGRAENLQLYYLLPITSYLLLPDNCSLLTVN